MSCYQLNHFKPYNLASSNGDGLEKSTYHCLKGGVLVSDIRNIMKRQLSVIESDRSVEMGTE